ncbi:GTP pyrophosphokinase [Paracoccus tegillarcae]|uniref:(P)ppGpp synthetase n=1 Tax=Paracoccus tegillarcae TaxID=1529068 RepID=A0A2K9EB18_9RHOB|nr:(p)ppGpp synthetase [Paracoccus tegillarcae]AUH32093.1 (p)ppGpp synthetase [Paracoccus tegillarcae]
MQNTDFEKARSAFLDFYNDNSLTLENAKQSLIALLSSLLSGTETVGISKIEGRVKNRDECLAKFNRKYRTSIESECNSYTIKDYISDLIGVRIVCLYSGEIEEIVSLLKEEFDVKDVTDKSAELEGTDATFGYKGVHVDLRLNKKRSTLPEYVKFSEFSFEVQLRTVVQDAWSVVDHKIKYKKSIPQNLKRRINTLAALFELADREFMAIRDETQRQENDPNESYDEINKETDPGPVQQDKKLIPKYKTATLDAFSFQRVANHFFNDFKFEDYKIDGFVDEIQKERPDTTRGKFNFYLKNAIAIAKVYAEHQEENGKEKLNPFSMIRHCLYYSEPNDFSNILTISRKSEFEQWLKKNPQNKPRNSSTVL